ncbi:9911_t:CDS:2 [Entrophospora sp. SA101]|nr:9911_t:CDS:2 [Entrophospora sp. SA101]CAJ0926526.1 207_t:CDS:2 [Entrophospora sp. SA101]
MEAKRENYIYKISNGNNDGKQQKQQQQEELEENDEVTTIVKEGQETAIANINNNIIIKDNYDDNDDDLNIDNINKINIKLNYHDIIQLHLALLEIDSFQETNKLDKSYNNNKSVGLPKFRYKYSEQKLALYLVQGGQVFIPLRVLGGIEKISDRVICLYLNDEDKYVSEQEIDIAGLHINYMIKARKNKSYSNWKEEQLIIKLHHSNTDEIKNYLITNSYKLSNLTNLIEKSYNFATGTIKQLKYKDYFNNFVKITNDLEFQIAISIYKIDKKKPSSSSNNEKFELWYDQQDQQEENDLIIM